MRNTPYQVKVDGSIGLKIPDPINTLDSISSFNIKNGTKKKKNFLLFGIAILLMVVGGYFWHQHNNFKIG